MSFKLLLNLLFSLSYLLKYKTRAKINILDTGMFPLQRGSVALQFYIDIENDHRSRSCEVHSWPRKCCLLDSEDVDCDTMFIYGGDFGLLEPKDRDSIVYSYLSLSLHDQTGFCDFWLNFKCGEDYRNKRTIITIPFNTTLYKYHKSSKYLLKNYINKDKVTECETQDGDSLNGCYPVDCDEKYLGTKPFFDQKSSKCTAAPVCLRNENKELPDIVYVPKANTCRDLDHPITILDVYGFSTGQGTVTEDYSNPVKVELKSNCSTISQNLLLLRDMFTGTLCPLPHGVTMDFNRCCMNALFSITIWIIGVAALVLSFICLIQTIQCVYKKWDSGVIKEKYDDFKSRLNQKSWTYNNLSTKVNKRVKNDLLREVIAKDLPLELRESIVNVCERIGGELKGKKQYRGDVICRQFSSGTSTSSSEGDENERLLK